MKISNKMIDRQLRLKGIVIKILMCSSNAAIFRIYQNAINMLLRGRNCSGLQCGEEWISINNGGSKLRARIYKPLKPMENAPGVLWIHGGGYACGLPELCVGTYRRLIAESNCVVVAPDYRLSIEAPYPAALEDCYETLLWMKNHAKELGIREDQIIVGGESAGGGLTAALAMYARDKGEVNIAFQMPLYPMLDDRMTSESARDNNAPVWNSRLNRTAWKLYLADLYEKDAPVYASPARATDYSNLPPAITFVGDIEPFRDETIKYVENLRKAGVPVDFEIFKGCYHSFEVVCPKAEASRKAIDFFMNSFRYAIDHYFAPQKQI
jgi:acetyl esterase/lipase